MIVGNAINVIIMVFIEKRRMAISMWCMCSLYPRTDAHKNKVTKATGYPNFYRTYQAGKGETIEDENNDLQLKRKNKRYSCINETTTIRNSNKK